MSCDHFKYLIGVGSTGAKAFNYADIMGLRLVCLNAVISAAAVDEASSILAHVFSIKAV